MSQTLEAVVLDHTVLTRSSEHLPALKQLLDHFRSAGLTIAVFSTDRYDLPSELAALGLPEPGVIVYKDNLDERYPGRNTNKGALTWMEFVSTELGIPTNHFLYVGDDILDWRTAINYAVLYIHAGWVAPLGRGMTAWLADVPGDVAWFADHFLLSGPRWQYKLDRPEDGLHVRSLLAAGAILRASPRRTFSLQDVFTYDRTITVSDQNARDLLMTHALTSLYLEGAIARKPYFVAYPSSKADRASPVLEAFLRPAAKLFHGFLREDLLIRGRDAPDTSLVRWRARQSGQTPNISILDQANTVYVNPKYRSSLQDRTVLVFDDFTTTGMSLEWARSLLQRAGAKSVVLITIGKYSHRYTRYRVSKEVRLYTPFSLADFKSNDEFSSDTDFMEADAAAAQTVAESFEAIASEDREMDDD